MKNKRIDSIVVPRKYTRVVTSVKKQDNKVVDFYYSHIRQFLRVEKPLGKNPHPTGDYRPDPLGWSKFVGPPMAKYTITPAMAYKFRKSIKFIQDPHKHYIGSGHNETKTQKNKKHLMSELQSHLIDKELQKVFEKHYEQIKASRKGSDAEMARRIKNGCELHYTKPDCKYHYDPDMLEGKPGKTIHIKGNLQEILDTPAEEVYRKESTDIFNRGFEGGTAYPDTKPLHHIRHPRPKRNYIRSLVSYISVLLIRPKFSDEALEKALLKSNHKIYEPTNKPSLFKRFINWIKR
jgi:hypothetical protein